MLLAIAATLALTAAPPAPAPAADAKGAALAAYQAKRYAEACALWEQASKAAPDDAAVLADLGLCYQKLGKTKLAVEAAHAAIAKGDDRTRRNAYYNLHALGVKVALPREGECGPLPAAPGCAAALFACTFSYSLYGSGGGSFGTAVRIAIDEQGAHPVDGAQPLDVATLAELQRERVGRQVAIDLLLDESSEDFCRGCDEVKDAAKRKKCADDCGKRRIQHTETCTVVAADACANAVGVVCKPAGGKAEVGEVPMDTSVD